MTRKTGQEEDEGGSKQGVKRATSHEQRKWKLQILRETEKTNKNTLSP